MNRTRLKALLVKHEGLRLTPYRCPAGKLTIGVGRNIEDKGFSAEERRVLGLDNGRKLDDGITADEARYLLDNDINEVWQALSAKLAGLFNSLEEARQHVLLDMAFNLGVAGLLKFRKMIAALERRDFERAADEMKDSTWYTQVGDRGPDLEQMMRSGR